HQRGLLRKVLQRPHHLRIRRRDLERHTVPGPLSRGSEKGVAMQGSEVVDIIRTVIEWAALTIEILGAAVIVAGVMRVAITHGTVRYLFRLDKPGAYENYKHQMGRSLL